MENIKKNPILMAVLNVVGVAAGLLLVDFVLSLSADPADVPEFLKAYLI